MKNRLRNIACLAGLLAASVAQAGVEYSMSQTKTPDHSKTPDQMADELLSLQRLQGLTKAEAEANRPSILRGFQDIYKGVTRSGVVRLSFADWGCKVDAFAPLMNGPTPTTPLSETFARGITVLESGPGTHPTISSGDARTFLCTGSEQAVLLGQLPKDATRVSSKILGATRYDLFEWKREHRLTERFELWLDSADPRKLRAATCWIERPIGGYNLIYQFRTSGGFLVAGGRLQPRHVTIYRQNNDRVGITEQFEFKRTFADASPALGYGLKANQVVIDRRLGAAAIVSYPWAGSPAPTSFLKERLNNARNATMTPEKSQWLVLGVGLLLFVSGIFMRLKSTGPRKAHLAVNQPAA